MTESSFRSRYAGMPGSLVAIRVDYARRGVAFDSLPSETEVAQSKREVKRWKMGHRLGDKPEWNTSAQPEGYVGSAPQRPLLHQLSEYQAIKVDYNFRASTLPNVNHTTRFVPKASKLQVDRSMFMSEKERAMLTDRNQGTATQLSRAEMKNHSLPGIDREGGWNHSTELHGDRTNIYRNREYERFLEVNKTKDVLDHSRYVPPQKRHEVTLKAQRDSKLTQREAALASLQTRVAAHSAPSSGSYGSSSSPLKVYKISNIDEWWDEDFENKMLATASAVLGRPITSSVEAAASTAGTANRTAEGAGAVNADP